MLTFDSLYLHNIISKEPKNWMLIANAWSMKQDSKTILLLIMQSDATARPKMIFSLISVYGKIYCNNSVMECIPNIFLNCEDFKRTMNKTL